MKNADRAIHARGGNDNVQTESLQRSLALTKLNEALMWANVAIAEAGVADYVQ